jgi:hypothetical protein
MEIHSIWERMKRLRLLSRRDQALDDYYTQLRADYDRLVSDQTPTAVVKFLEEVESLHKQDRLTWARLFAFERMILMLLPADDVAARAWHLRDRYRNIVSKDQYALYENSHPTPSTSDALKKEMDSLLLTLSEYYVLRQGIELQRTEFSHRVQMMTGVLLLILGISHPAVRSMLLTHLKAWHEIAAIALGLLLSVAGWWTGREGMKNYGVATIILSLIGWLVASSGTLQDLKTATINPAISPVATCASGLPPFVTTLIMVIIAGLFGGAFSMLQRLQSPIIGGDQLSNLMSLRTARREIFLAPIIGAVGALVLYCIFDAELLKGALFPIMYPVKSSDGSQSFAAYLCSAGPQAGVDQAKLLVWSFVAGFSERLLPDSLDRLSKQAAPSSATTK